MILHLALSHPVYPERTAGNLFLLDRFCAVRPLRLPVSPISIQTRVLSAAMLRNSGAVKKQTLACRGA
jgi:hypothetical protein